MFVVLFEIQNQRKSFRSNSKPVVISNGRLAHILVDGGKKVIESPKESYKGYISALEYSRNIIRG